MVPWSRMHSGCYGMSQGIQGFMGQSNSSCWSFAVKGRATPRNRFVAYVLHDACKPPSRIRTKQKIESLLGRKTDESSGCQSRETVSKVSPYLRYPSRYSREWASSFYKWASTSCRLDQFRRVSSDNWKQRGVSPCDWVDYKENGHEEEPEAKYVSLDIKIHNYVPSALHIL